VHTEVITRKDVRRAYRLVSDVVERGQQAYLVCPLIEHSEQDERRLQAAAEEVFQQLRGGIFPSLKLGLVHGKLPAAEREAVMEAFRQGELEALVTTTVIEVGVDVPTATAMVIMDAERFGLAQLHQLRGRVARSQSQAYCVLVTDSRSDETIDRLKVLERTSDGFLVAEEDLRRRGPGEMAGFRQSGLPDPRMADLLADTPTLARAREDAFALVEGDPDLRQPDHAGLQEALGPEPKGTAWTL
jgi:ATP-dependent DNA helicase RecG